MNRCWYVSETWGIHDQRWVSALTSEGFTPTVLSVARDGVDLSEIRTTLVSDDPSVPVLAGPLTAITHALVGIPHRLVGLSWGFDLADPGARDLTWLTQLDHLIVDSPATRTIAIGAGLAPDQISEIPWGVDLNQFTPEGPLWDLTDLGVAPHTQTVVSLRAHEPMYRVGDVIEAWAGVLAELPGSILLVANEGSETDQLRRRVAELGIETSVHFLGRVPEGDLAPLLRVVDAYVSTSPIDGTSVTLLQAMACQAPVIVADIPGNSAWITEGVTGRLFPPSDTRTLAHQIAATLREASRGAGADMTVAARGEVVHRADWRTNTRSLGRALAP